MYTVKYLNNNYLYTLLSNNNNTFLLCTDTDIGQVTFDANVPVPQNKSFLFTVIDNNIALELHKLFTLGIRHPIEAGITESSQMSITVIDDDGD